MDTPRTQHKTWPRSLCASESVEQERRQTERGLESGSKLLPAVVVVGLVTVFLMSRCNMKDQDGSGRV